MRRFRRNPPLTVFSNPPMRVPFGIGKKQRDEFQFTGIIGGDVHLIRYTHHKDEKFYEHEFETEVVAYAVKVHGRRAVLLMGEQDIWDDYPDTMGDFD